MLFGPEIDRALPPGPERFAGFATNNERAASAGNAHFIWL